MATTRVLWVGWVSAQEAPQWRRKEMQLKDKGRGAQTVVPVHSVVILNRWGSISTFKLQENRKGLRFRPVIWCEEASSQIHCPFLKVTCFPFPWKCWFQEQRETNWLWDQEYQAENGQEMPSLLISTIALYLSLRKSLKGCVWECMCFLFIVMPAYI